MARGRNHNDGYAPRNANGAAWAMVMIMFLAAAAFVAWLAPEIAFTPGLPERARGGAVGGQAPKDVRGTFRGSDTYSPIPPEAAINAYNATAQAEYDAAIQAGAQNPPIVFQVATPPPLPLNSAGEPVISQAQQQQMQQSLELAEQEGAAAVDQQLADQRAAQNAADLARPPDVSYEDAKKLLGRDPCSVPRANPVTCKQGLYKPTPVNE